MGAILKTCSKNEETEGLRVASETHSVTDLERMEYAQADDDRRTTLGAIACAASVGPRACTRCFSRCPGMTPIHHVTQCRPQTASDKLLRTGDSIGEIAAACGFASPGCFSQTFSQVMGCAPREYRAPDGVVMRGAD